MSKCTNDFFFSKTVPVTLHNDLIFFFLIEQCLWRGVEVYECTWVCSYCIVFFPLKTLHDDQQQVKNMYLALIYPFQNNTHQIAQFLVPQYWRKSCSWKIISVCVYVLCIFLCEIVFFLCTLWKRGLLKDQCERPTVCQSAGCWGCGGLEGAGAAWRRGWYHLDDGE